MPIYSTYQDPLSPKIEKVILFADHMALPYPFQSPYQTGQRSTFGNFRREIRNFSANLSVGGLRINTLDVGSNIATYLDGSYFTGRGIAVWLTSVPENDRVFDGFVKDTGYKDGILNLELVDKFYNLKDAKFTFDYQNIKHYHAGITHGTVYDIQGQNIYFTMPDTQSLYYNAIHGAFKGVAELPSFISQIGDQVTRNIIRWAPFKSDYARTAFRKAVDYDNYITEANYVKFSERNFTGIYRESEEFDSISAYRVAGGAFIATNSDGDPHLIDDVPVIIATLEIENFFSNIKRGDNVYFRKPLYLSGNPAEIIKGILRGDHNTLPETLGSIAIDENSFATANAYLQHFHTFKEYVDSDAGDVGNEIDTIAKEIFVDVFMDRNGTVHINPIRPYGNDVSVNGSFYDSENSWDFDYENSIDDAAYRIEAKYGYKHYPDYTTWDTVDFERWSVKIPYHDRAIIMSKDFEHLHDPDEVIAVCSRELFWRRRGVTWWEWTAPLFGLEMELGSYTTIQNTVFPGGSHIAHIDSIDINLESNIVKFRAWDYSQCFLNFYIAEWQGDSVTLPTNVAATSNSGWVRIDPEIIGSIGYGDNGFFIVAASNMAASIATLYIYTYPNPIGAIDWSLYKNMLSTTGYHFKQLASLGYDDPYGTYTYRFQRLWGAADLEYGASGTYHMCGTSLQSMIRASQPISELTDAFGDPVAGTVDNLDNKFGSVSIFW